MEDRSKTSRCAVRDVYSLSSIVSQNDMLMKDAEIVMNRPNIRAENSPQAQTM